MNLSKLFEMQAALDTHIEHEHPGVADRLEKKILALLVELGELANEWRGFKFWSNNQEPRINIARDCKSCDGRGFEDVIEFECEECEGYGFTEYYNPLLEEYVDCLHFILSIGLEKGYEQVEFPYLHEVNVPVFKQINTLQQFNSIFYAVSNFVTCDSIETYEELFLYFIALAEHLNFKWEQIEQAYIKKNEVNHQRQLNGY